jgi:serine/threonine protein kinase
MKANHRIGTYSIISLLGSGGMGEVYLARDVRLGRKVALKLLPSTLVNDEHRVRRFHQEARAASALNHPNILTIYDIGEVDSTHFIAAEFVKGKTLRHHISAGKMNLQQIVDIIIQVASALAAAHEVGVVHRDIKPENIMIRPDGYVKVLDFGLAKLTERASIERESEIELSPLVSTEPGMVMGTPLYMSPEQVRGLDVDGRTDIFTLGIVLYEMVTCRTPFQGATTSDVIAAILRSEPPLLTHSSMEVPPQLQQVVITMLKKDRDKRYQAVDSVLADLRSLRERQARAPDSYQTTLPMRREDAPTVFHTNQPAVSDTPKRLVAQSNMNPAPLTIRLEPIIAWIKHLNLSAIVILTVITLAVIAIVVYRFGIGFTSTGGAVNSSDKHELPARQKPYAQMTNEEQESFVREQAQRISAMLGERPTALSNGAVLFIKKHVDSYAARANSLSEKQWAEGLRVVFGRASQYAPVIVRCFSSRQVPPIIGLYIPMIESEYRACLNNEPVGVLGMYQFMPETAVRYGVNPKDRCDVEKIIPAAAEYIADRIFEFGSDSMSMTLAIYSFNVNPDSIRSNLSKLRSDNRNIERSFWALFENADKLDMYFREEGINYVPKFFAAAIVGENPEAFGLPLQPLSTLN